MKAIAALVMFLLSTAAAAEPWSNEEKQLAGLAAGLYLADWAQTRDISRRPQEYIETNPFLGAHPSLGEVNRTFALEGVALGAVALVMPDAWRIHYLRILTNNRAMLVMRNNAIGLRIAF